MKKILNYLIMISIKNKIFRFVQFFFNYLGLRIHISNIDSTKDIQLINKNIWIPYFDKKDYLMNLYREGLSKSKNEWSNNISKELRFYSLFQLALYSIKTNKNYNFAECGCWYGHSAYSISKILLDNNFAKHLYVFDSFEGGLSDLSKQDRNLTKQLSKDEIDVQKKIFSSSEIFVSKLLSEFNFVKIHKGWIPNEFIKVEKELFQFVHIDADLYQPTLDSLEFFYPRLCAKGIIVIDDYNLTQFEGAKKAVDEFLLKVKYSFFYASPFGGCYILK